MAQRRGSMDDSFHLPNFPHMAWVDPISSPSAAPSIAYLTRAMLNSNGWDVLIDDISLHSGPDITRITRRDAVLT